MRTHCSLMLVLGIMGMITLPLPVVAEPVIAKSQALIAQTPLTAETTFDFIVTGDTQSNRQLVFQTDLFKCMIAEWNVLKPVFVVEVGDLILGGSAENVPPQWDLFECTIADLEVPYFPVPGNHDISDILTEKIWLDRMGPTHYAFSYGNSRFIVLDSEEVDALDRLSDTQVAWLKQELESTKANNIFLFLHQPYFADEGDPRNFDKNWERRWKYLADVMHGHPVRAVFAGHLHGYCDFGVRDGVHYVIAAGGAYLNGPEEFGQFSHYLLVRVRGEEVTWSVIKPGAILPSNVATNTRVAEFNNIKRNLVVCDEVAVPIGDSVDRDISVRIENPSEKPFDSSVAWEIPKGWKVEPVQRNYHVDGKGIVTLPFHVRSEDAGAARFPVPKFKTRYDNTSFGKPIEVSTSLPLIPVGEAMRATRPIHIDGVLDEWQAATPIKINYPSGFEEGKYDPADLSGQCRVMWDTEHLYLAFEIVDNVQYQPYAGDIVWLNDAIEFGIDRWGWGFSLTNAGPEVFAYYGEGVSAETVNKDVTLAVRRAEGRTVYEAALPAALVKPLTLKTGSTFAFHVQVNDRDGASGAKHELALKPGGDNDRDIRIILKK